MKQRLFRWTRLTSLVLSVATAVVWLSTYFVSVLQPWLGVGQNSDEIRVSFLEISTRRGEITLTFDQSVVPLTNLSVADQKLAISYRDQIHQFHPAPRWFSPYNFTSRTGSFLGIMGFEIGSTTVVRGIIKGNHFQISLPFWFLFLAFAALPAARPSKRIIHAMRHAPPPAPSQRPAWRERILKTIAAAGIGAFLAIHMILYLTRSAGWSVRWTTRNATFVEFAARERRFSLTLLSDWPRPEPLAFIKTPDTYRLMYPYRDNWSPLVDRGFVGVNLLKGRASFYFDEDGSPSLLPYGKNPYYSSTRSFQYMQIQVSMLLLALLAAVLPAILIIRLIRRRVRRFTAIKHSLCTTCGYNLAGNVSGVCPECGAPCEHSPLPKS